MLMEEARTLVEKYGEFLSERLSAVMLYATGLHDGPPLTVDQIVDELAICKCSVQIAIKQSMLYLAAWEREEAEGLHLTISAYRAEGKTATQVARLIDWKESRVKSSLGWRLGGRVLDSDEFQKVKCPYRLIGYDCMENGPDPKLPECPDCHNPGSPERIAALSERYQHRQHLWHPKDKRESGKLTV